MKWRLNLYLLIAVAFISAAACSKKESALIEAAERGDTVKALLEKGADVSAKDKVYVATPLMHAAMGGHTGIVQALLEKGADINAKNKHHRTALMIAARRGHSDTVKALLEKGADINTRAIFGNTALMDAAINNQTLCLQALLAAGADVNIPDKWGNTPLMEARRFHCQEIVPLLEQAGAKG